MTVAIFLGCWLLAAAGWGFDWKAADVSVRSTSKYVVQWSDEPGSQMEADEDQDQDFYQMLGIDLRWDEPGITIATLGRWDKDLDGTENGSFYQDYKDSRGDHRQDFEIFYAYLEKKDLAPGLDVRLGRQYAYGAEVVHFDGLYADYQRPDWSGFEAELFGGRIVQHYSDLGQDSVGGFNLGFHPVASLGLYLYGVFYEENSWEASTIWQPCDHFQGRGNLAFINSHTRYIDLNGETTIAKTGTIINLGFYRRYNINSEDDFLYDYTYTLDESLSDDLNRLYLQQEEGYYEYDLQVTQPLPGTPGLNVYGRYTIRRLAHDKHENLYNTDFDRYTLGFSIDEWLLWKGFHFDAGVSRWEEDRDKFYEEESTSYYADWRQELGERFELGAGYYHKNEDVNSMIENEASTRYLASVGYKVKDNCWLKLAYEYNEDDYYEDELGVDHINTLTLSLHLEY